MTSNLAEFQQHLIIQEICMSSTFTQKFSREAKRLKTPQKRNGRKKSSHHNHSRSPSFAHYFCDSFIVLSVQFTVLRAPIRHSWSTTCSFLFLELLHTRKFFCFFFQLNHYLQRGFLGGDLRDFLEINWHTHTFKHTSESVDLTTITWNFSREKGKSSTYGHLQLVLLNIALADLCPSLVVPEKRENKVNFLALCVTMFL